MSRELMVELVAELETLHGLLVERARKLRAAATLLHEIESIMEKAATPSAASTEEAAAPDNKAESG